MKYISLFCEVLYMLKLWKLDMEGEMFGYRIFWHTLGVSALVEWRLLGVADPGNGSPKPLSSMVFLNMRLARMTSRCRNSSICDSVYDIVTFRLSL